MMLLTSHLSSIRFASLTEGLDASPVLEHALRALVPRFMLVKEEHLIPNQAQNSPTLQRSKAKMASLGISNPAKPYVDQSTQT